MNDHKEIIQKHIKIDIKSNTISSLNYNLSMKQKTVSMHRLDKIEEKIDTIVSWVEKQEVEIKVLRGGK